ncbi:hypothetical protein SAMN05421759_11066 [Roseivivax lentus]|uniref:Uncharacterized protein n=1 Tax=Roseivivax lentus TaxID=633194 RepID=A0A1N7NU81_9RHOB|nr:hypothetical protein [Roseivivax lentus]SIT01923.1 hypothetical protein SAMN05421759_11066 [Roseivivax lentus]
MTESVVHIDGLALNGFTLDEGRRAAEAFEARLSELLNRYGLPEGVAAEDIGAIDLGSLPAEGKTPEGIGQALAAALFGRLWT